MSWTVRALSANLQKVNLKQGPPTADQTSQIANITRGGVEGLVRRLKRPLWLRARGSGKTRLRNR